MVEVYIQKTIALNQNFDMKYANFAMKVMLVSSDKALSEA